MQNRDKKNKPAGPKRPPSPASPPVELAPGRPYVGLKSVSFGSFIFEQMVDRVQGDVFNGDLVPVLDRHGRVFGWGFYNGASRIALRMVSHGSAEPDESFIAQRVRQAVMLRRQTLGLDLCTDSYRLIHSEGDGLSGLVADKFADYVVIELFSIAMHRRIEMIEDAIVDSGVSVREFIIRADERVCKQEGFTLDRRQLDRKDRQVVITENGVKFNVRLARMHKTGFFCDQRDNRLALTALTPGKRMLDIACYTGGFSCYATAIGKAASVQGVDLDEKALEVAQQNAALNGAHIDFTHRDAFDFLRESAQSGKQWDVVVVDPSKFVPNRTMMDVGLRKYADLNRLALSVVAPGGVILTCSCSGLVDQATFVQVLDGASRSAGRKMRIFRISGAAGDHPFGPDAPEASYLKAVWARVE